MPLQVTVDTIDAVPEAVREFYVPTEDGKFRLDGIDDAAALKRSLDNAKKERAEARAALDRLKGVDADEYARLKKDAEERELQAATKKGEFEKIKQQMADKHKAELDAFGAEKKEMLGSLESYLVDAEATRAIAGAKGVPELLLPHVRAQVRVVKEGGRYVAKVVDRDGNPRIGDASGEPMTINQLVAEMRQSEVFGRAFEGTGATGGGATQSRTPGNAKTITRAQLEALPPYERGAALKGKQLVD